MRRNTMSARSSLFPFAYVQTAKRNFMKRNVTRRFARFSFVLRPTLCAFVRVSRKFYRGIHRVDETRKPRHPLRWGTSWNSTWAVAPGVGLHRESHRGSQQESGAAEQNLLKVQFKPGLLRGKWGYHPDLSPCRQSGGRFKGTKYVPQMDTRLKP